MRSEICLTLLRFVPQLCHNKFGLQITQCMWLHSLLLHARLSCMNMNQLRINGLLQIEILIKSADIGVIMSLVPTLKDKKVF